MDSTIMWTRCHNYILIHTQCHIAFIIISDSKCVSRLKGTQTGQKGERIGTADMLYSNPVQLNA